MLLSSSPRACATVPRHSSTLSKKHRHISFKKPSQASYAFTCLRFGLEDLALLAHNKVLVAAAVSAGMGQFSKPFTSGFYGRGIDFKSAFRSGGMPSTHSSGVVAAATSLGLERGFSDSIFGMSVVFAALVMYDAQGVRREVGYHAKILNRILLKTRGRAISCREEDEIIESQQPTSSSTSESLASLLSALEDENSSVPRLVAPPTRRVDNNKIRPSISGSSSVGDEEMFRMVYGNNVPLFDSVGHTELEVVIGALLGFLAGMMGKTGTKE